MIGINLFKHQELSADISKDAFYSGKKLHLTTDPTGFGKTFLFTVLCKWLKEKEPDLQFIISAAQKEQVKEIADAFRKYTDLRTIVIPGGEDQMRYLVFTEEGREALENVKEASREYLNMAYAGEETNDFIEKRYNLFLICIDNAASDIVSVEDQKARMDKLADDDPRREKLKERLDSFRSSLSSNYSTAERIIGEAILKISDTQVRAEFANFNELDKEQRKILIRNEYKKQLRYMDPFEKVFPDIKFEISDVAVLTHAKLFRSILTKRRFMLADISKIDGGNIVLFIDEVESFRSNYTDYLVDMALDRSADMLGLLNIINASIRSGFFENDDYVTKNNDGTVNREVAERAKDLLDSYEPLHELYGYNPNLRMENPANRQEVPQITNSIGYIIQKNAEDKYVGSDDKKQVLTLSPEAGSSNKAPDKAQDGKEQPEQAKQNETEEKKREPTLINFVIDARRLINGYVGLIRRVAHTIDVKWISNNIFSDADRANYTAVGRALYGDPESAAARYVLSNIYPSYGKRLIGKLHPYRMGISYTRTRQEHPRSDNMSLYNTNIPRFPEAELEDYVANLRFVYVFSGTGWLNALNNFNFDYLKDDMYIPDPKASKAVHDAYIEWKKEQYKGTDFCIERICGNEKNCPDLISPDNKNEKKEKIYVARDVDASCQYMNSHMSMMQEHGVSGGTGAIICTPRDLAGLLVRHLVRSGTDMSRIAVLRLKKGKIHELDKNGTKSDREVCTKEGDTFYIDVSDGRFYYLFTAFRSGTRGYNVAFKNGENIYDASGIFLYHVTKVIPQRDEPNENSTYKQIERDTTKHILTANMAYLHCMFLHDGKIDAEIMKNVSWIIKRISYDYGIMKKDIYESDPWSPYKLQGTSEILQALGRIRNNKKMPLIYIGINNDVFAKNQLREEQLDMDCLSYEALQVAKRLPALWAEYERDMENKKRLSSIDEAALRKSLTSLAKSRIPSEKKALSKGNTDIEKLADYAAAFDAIKEASVSLNLRPAAVLWGPGKKPIPAYNQIVKNLWLADNNPFSQPSIYPFEYSSYYDSEKGATVYTREILPGKAYITPSSLLLTETVRMFSSFCEKEMKELMPAIMDKKTLDVMRRKDMFPYAMASFTVDVFKGEYGERLFSAMMKKALLLEMTEFAVTHMPLPQYEDYDFTVLRKDGSVAGYANVKYRSTKKFELERTMSHYKEKLLRSPLTGTIRLLYIDMCPAGERSDNVYTEEKNDYIKKINKDLKKYGKRVEVYAMALFSKDADIYIDRDDVITAITNTIRKINQFFIG